MRSIAALVAVLAAAAACKGKLRNAEAVPPKRDAAPLPAVDWTRCEQAICNTHGDVPVEKAVANVLDACQVCGDWTPLLDWNRPSDQGGPTRQAIEQRMTACRGWCDANAKDVFLGTLDGARGTPSRAPWRHLAEVCKDQVSAASDARYMSAAYFALDRIARSAAAHGGDVARHLSRVELRLPAVSLTGAGVELPRVADAVPKTWPSWYVTILGDGLHVGGFATASLTPDGVRVSQPGEPYPGKLVRDADWAHALAELTAAGSAGECDPCVVALIAPREMPATKVVDAIAGVVNHKLGLVLAVDVTTPIPGWDETAAIDTWLAAGSGADPGRPTSPLAVDDKMTVQDLADALAQGHHEAARLVRTP